MKFDVNLRTEFYVHRVVEVILIYFKNIIDVTDAMHRTLKLFRYRITAQPIYSDYL